MIPAKPYHFLRRAGAVGAIAGAALLAPAYAGTAAGAHTMPSHAYLGPAVSIGQGTARVVVTIDKAGRPSAVGVVLTAGVLEGLPAKPGKDPELDHDYFLAFPAGAPATGYSHLMIDWHPMGHPPKGIYTVPHFDFHFYTIDRKSQMAIRYAHPETPDMTGVAMPKPALVPAGYFIPPGTQVSEMGLHAVPKAAPEFHGKPFTNTFIYGYAGGRLAFVEPMITRAYLKGRPHYSAKLAVPREYSTPGYYPTRYTVAYDARAKVYRVMLAGLAPWHAEELMRPGNH